MRFNCQRHMFVTLLLFLVAWKVFWTTDAVAQDVQGPAIVPPAAETEEKKMDAGEARKRSKFDYQLDNRPDPFYPFLKKEEDKTKDEIVDDVGKPLTGMQLFEPGQLRLVAVMGIQGSKIAMAEDMGGKGYILREDMLIGKYGQIMQIGDGQVFIKETLKTKAGREIINNIVMSLKKDEGKP